MLELKEKIYVANARVPKHTQIRAYKKYEGHKHAMRKAPLLIDFQAKKGFRMLECSDRKGTLGTSQGGSVPLQPNGTMLGGGGQLPQSMA